jgi:uroporphyrinogen-III synthase
MRILVTRAEDEAGELAKLLAARGHQTIIAPLLAIRFEDGADISLAGVQAVLASSANGVRALAQRTKDRGVPVFAVGPQTAEAARIAGFADVRSADGDAIALANATSRWADPKKGALLHATGVDRDGRLGAALREKGFDVRVATLYEAVGATALPKPAADALQSARLDAALFFSPRSATLFRDCTMREGLAESCRTVMAVAISKAAAAALAPLAFREIRIAKAPNQDALLACLG